MQFRDLPIGAKFSFPRDLSIFNSGYGSCVKVSARRYRDEPARLTDGKYGIKVITHAVGSINTVVNQED